MVKKIRSAAFDAAIIAEYGKWNAAKPVATKFDVSDETVYRVLKAHGIPRTKGKRERVSRLSNCHTDFCPALVMMLHEQKFTGRDISKIVGCSPTGVYRIIRAETNRPLNYRYYFRTCPVCGRKFKTTNGERQVCNECLPHEHNSNHRKRARQFGCEYTPGITLDKLILRDGDTCKICGGKCNRDDKEWGHFGPTYPTIDHIKPMHLGGGHTWENVQLAHLKCNILKSDKAVNQNAQEQAITDQPTGVHRGSLGQARQGSRPERDDQEVRARPRHDRFGPRHQAACIRNAGDYRAA